MSDQWPVIACDQPRVWRVLSVKYAWACDMCDWDEWIILQSHYLVIHRPFRVNKNLQFCPGVCIVCELKLHFPTKYKQASLCRTINQTYKWLSKNSVICGLFSRYFVSQQFCQVVMGTRPAPGTANCSTCSTLSSSPMTGAPQCLAHTGCATPPRSVTR